MSTEVLIIVSCGLLDVHCWLQACGCTLQVHACASWMPAALVISGYHSRGVHPFCAFALRPYFFALRPGLACAQCPCVCCWVPRCMPCLVSNGDHSMTADEHVLLFGHNCASADSDGWCCSDQQQYGGSDQGLFYVDALVAPGSGGARSTPQL